METSSGADDEDCWVGLVFYPECNEGSLRTAAVFPANTIFSVETWHATAPIIHKSRPPYSTTSFPTMSS